MIPPAEVQEDVPAIRTSIFDRLTFPKRVVNINKGEDEEEPSFTITAEGEKSGIFKKPKATSTKSFAMGRPRLTKRKMPTPQAKANFVSFQDSRNDSPSSFINSFEALRTVKENS